MAVTSITSYGKTWSNHETMLDRHGAWMKMLLKSVSLWKHEDKHRTNFLSIKAIKFMEHWVKLPKNLLEIRGEVSFVTSMYILYI
jgi:hypothetical protein